MEERARHLAKLGRVASAGAMFRFLGTMMYNSEDMLLARKIVREEKEKEVHTGEGGLGRGLLSRTIRESRSSSHAL